MPNLQINGTNNDDDHQINNAQPIDYYALNGDDTVHNWADHSNIFGQNGDDTIVNTSANYVSIDGGKNNDTINNLSSDYTTINGGSHNDTIYNVQSNYSIINGGNNIDTITIEDSTNVTVNGDNGFDVITVIGGTDNDLTGGKGDDKLTGGSGQETMHYHFANNTSSKDTYNGGGGIDTLNLYFNFQDLQLLADTHSESDMDAYLDLINSKFNENSNVGFNEFGFKLTANNFETLNIHIPDLPPSTFSVTDASVVEKSNNNNSVLSFTVTIDHPLNVDQNVSVDYATSDITTNTTSDLDIHHQQGTLIFEPGQTSKTIEIEVVGDNIPEIDETFGITLSNPVGAVISQDQATGTIIDNDIQFITGSSQDDTYNNDSNITVNYKGGLGNDDITNSDHESSLYGQGGNDQLYNTGADVLLNGGQGNDNIVSEGDNSTLIGGSGKDTIYNYGNNSNVSGNGGNDTIYNNTLNPEDNTSQGSESSISGGSGNDTIHNALNTHVNISGDSGADVINNNFGDFAAIDGGNGTDAITNMNSTDVSIHGGTSSDTIINDASNNATIFGDDGTDTITNKNSDNALINGGLHNDIIHNINSHNSVINGDSQSDTITVDNSLNATINGGDGNDTITITGGDAHDITGGSGFDRIYGGNGQETLHYHYADNLDNGDHYYGGDGTDTLNLHFSHQELQALSAASSHSDINAYLDTVRNKFNNNEQSWFNNEGFKLLSNGIEELNIHVSDMPSTISVSNASVVESSNQESSLLEFTVNVTHPVNDVLAAQSISVDYTTAGLSASGLINADFKLTQGTLVFEPGETSQIIQVEVHGDSRFEGDETINLHLSNADNASISQADAIGTIIDDDIASTDPLQAPIYNSNLGAQKIIYLDFDGASISDTAWNQSHGIDTIIATAFDTDGDKTSFTQDEIDRIEKITTRVAEDFNPFNVNVTTDLDVYQNADSGDRLYTVIGDGIPGGGFNTGGGAYRSVVNDNNDFRKPSFALASDKKPDWLTAETISHELGHNLGLSHDGIPGDEYYNGHNNWNSILGSGPSKNNDFLTQWNKGEYKDADNQQDDIAIIEAAYGFREDDYGNTLTDAGLLHTGDGLAAEGIIEQRTDVDIFAHTAYGNVEYQINGIAAEGARGTNLDILAKLYSDDGTLLASSDPQDSLSATIEYQFDEATDVYLSIEGTGKGDPLDDGYSDYGSLGYYSVTIA